MLIRCLGGCREVGKNAIMLDTEKEKILMDYGMKVETGETPIPINNVDSILLSHPHLDHVGSVPILFRKFSKKQKVYSTAASFDQSHLLLKDSIKIGKLKGRPSLYGEKEVEKMKQNEVIFTYGQQFSAHSTKIDAVDAGHIPGSSMLIVNSERKRIMYTGDFTLQPSRLLNGAKINGIKDIDVLIMETTYSSREHTPRKQIEKKLLDLVKETVDNNGIAVIPSFAVGRSAELIMVLDKLTKKIPIFLDGMARTATEIALKYPELLRDPKALKKAMKDVIVIKNHESRKRVLEQPCAVVTTGGCIDGGPAVHYIKHLYTKSECSLLFTGFMIPRTAGRYLQDTGRFVNEGMDLKVKMNTQYLDFSGHADRSDLFKTIQTIRPEKVICIHGEHAERFATEVKGRFGIDAIAPFNGDKIRI